MGAGRDAELSVRAPEAMRETSLIDAQLEFGPMEPSAGERFEVRWEHGDRRATARLAWLGGSFWQLRLERPVLAAAGERLEVRRLEPRGFEPPGLESGTGAEGGSAAPGEPGLGLGRVLDAGPRRHGPSRNLLVALSRLARGEEPAEPDSR